MREKRCTNPAAQAVSHTATEIGVRNRPTGKDAHCVSLCKAHGIDGKWNLPGKGDEEPFVLFDEKENAYACATELKNSSEGMAAPLDEDDGFSPLPSHGDCIGFRGAGQAVNAR